MEDLIYKLRTIITLRKAVSQTYNSISDIDDYLSCISVVDDIEEQIINDLTYLFENSQWFFICKILCYNLLIITR